jgi:hypothetical protein
LHVLISISHLHTNTYLSRAFNFASRRADARLYAACCASYHCADLVMVRGDALACATDVAAAVAAAAWVPVAAAFAVLLAVAAVAVLVLLAMAAEDAAVTGFGAACGFSGNPAIGTGA